ncbi:MAG: hypothetical protein LBU42_09435 [Prevotellaceae bacterium]|jgi:hypothetical protein|nr:hypothetical protein [Prevotellaceae bacterium]
MKIFLFFFALLGGCAAFAQAIVTPISADYDKSTVTFRVAWSGTAANNRVWVFVDLCPAPGTAPGTFAKAVISGATATAGSILTVAGNTRGFYVTTNPSTVTATLSNATGKFNWCAYGSNFPPNAIHNASGGYDLRGTPPFIITTADGTATVNADTYSGEEITALTDATGCPGAPCGNDGESSGVIDCCVPGTTNCSGTCKKDTTYTTNDGACTGACNTGYVQLRNQCGEVIDPRAAETTISSCLYGCPAARNSKCWGCSLSKDCKQITAWSAYLCQSDCTAANYIYYDFDVTNAAYCFCCN